MEELTLKDIILIVKKRWWIVFTITVLAATTVAAVSIFAIKPVYQADTTLYIGRSSDTQDTIAYNDLLVNNQLVNDYRELVKSRMVSSTVIKELKLKGMTEGDLARKLNVNSKRDTRLIVISALDEDPELARAIADKVAEVFKRKVADIMKLENVQVIDKAFTPSAPVKPNVRFNVAVAALLGLVVSLGLVFLIEYMDNTIKTPEDVEKYLGLPVIATIPRFED